jgi:multidrug resistance efflux pump
MTPLQAGWEQDVLQVQAAVLPAGTLERAAIAMAVECAQLFGAQLAAVALLDDRGELALAGNTGAAALDPRQELGAGALAAAHEALDQGRSLAWPPFPACQEAILAAHRQWSAGESACTALLAAEGRAVGAIVLRRATPFAPVELERLEHVASFAAPVLSLRRELSLGWRARARRAWSSARQRMAGRKAWVGAAVLLAASLAVPVPWRVSAPARLEGAVQRAVVAASEGFVQQVNAKPGDSVVAGQVLVELASQDLELERRRRESELRQHETAYQAAQVRYDRTAMVASRARAAEAQSLLALAEAHLERARVTAPFDGIVVKGDLYQSPGAPVQRGEVLMVLAPAGEFRLLLEVDEADIAAVRPGQGGVVALASAPARPFPFTVKRVVPVASSAEGRNFFEVEAEVRQADPELRPGLGGVGKIEVGRRSLWQLLTARAANWLRLAWWTLTP